MCQDNLGNHYLGRGCSDGSEAFEEFFSNLEVNPHNISNIEDLIEFTEATPEEQYEKYGAEWFENARDALGTSASDAVLQVKSRMEHLGEDVTRLLDKHNCDVLLATSSTDLPLDLGRLPGISRVGINLLEPVQLINIGWRRPVRTNPIQRQSSLSANQSNSI